MTVQYFKDDTETVVKVDNVLTIVFTKKGAELLLTDEKTVFIKTDAIASISDYDLLDQVVNKQIEEAFSSRD